MSIDLTTLSSEAQQLFDAAMGLPDGERAKLADRLFLSIEPRAVEEAEKTFEATVARRIAEIEKGTARLVDWSDLRRELQERIDAARRIQAS